MIYLFIIASFTSLAINLRHGFKMPTETEVAGLLKGDLRYRRSLGSLFGSMLVGLSILALAVFFSFADESQTKGSTVVGMLFYYPAYYWVTALGYSELLGKIFENKFQISDPLLKPRLFAITRNRAQRVQTIMAVLWSLLLIGQSDAAGSWAQLVQIVTIVACLAWVPVNIAYFKAAAKAANWAYPRLLDTSAAKVSVVLAGVIFHLLASMLVPLMILAAPFLLPKILRRDKEIADLQAQSAQP